MNKKYVLREFFPLCEGGICQDLLTEDEKRFVAEGGMIISGKLQQANTKNGNGRVYSEAILKREVNNYQKSVRERRALGELDHPDDSVINLRNASHMITEIWWDNDSVMGKIKVLNTPNGNILRALVKDEVTLGASSRGVGSVTEGPDGTMVNEDFQLICFDMVSEPSTPGAYMSLSEGKIKETFSKADRINRALNDILED